MTLSQVQHQLAEVRSKQLQVIDLLLTRICDIAAQGDLTEIATLSACVNHLSDLPITSTLEGLKAPTEEPVISAESSSS